MTDIDSLIKEIAAKHQIAVGRDDPILILHTINARLLADSHQAQQQMLDDYKAQMESIAGRWETEAKAKAERILNASLNANKDAMAVHRQETAAQVRKEVEAALAEMSKPMQDARKIALWNIAAAAVTLLAVIIALSSLFLR